jgi:hypothetical protein
MQITPGYTFTQGEEITEEKLNLLGTPTGELTQEEFDELAEAAGSNMNLVVNPDLFVWERGVGPVTCEVYVKTELAEGWWVRPRYAAAVMSPYSFTPVHGAVQSTYQRESVAGPALQIYRARISHASGAAGEVGAVDFGQNIPGRITAAWTDDGCTLTVDVENQTGVSFTPAARFYQNADLDVWTDTPALVVQVNGTAVTGSNTLGNGERRVFNFRFTAAALAGAVHKGGEIALTIPEGAAGSGYVRVYGIIKLEVGQTPTARVQEREQTPSTSSGSTDGAADYFINGDFAPSLYVNDGANVSCAVGETEVALGWTVINSAGTVTAAADTTVPATTSGYSLKITGDATATSAVQVRQKLYRAGALTARRSLVWQAEVRNGTGADLTPVLVVKTCDSADDFSTLTTRLTQALTTIGNGDWVRESVVIDADALTNFGNGAAIELQFPANSLDSTGKNVRVAEASLVPGSDAAAAWVPVPALDFSPAPLVSFENLRVDSDDTLANVSWDALVLRAVDGRARRFGAGSCTVDTSVTGVGGLDTGTVANDTEYHLWLIGRDDGVEGVASLSATAPGGAALTYPFHGRISSLFTAAALGWWRKFWQAGRRVHVESGAVSYTPSDANFHSLSLAAFVPTTAVAVSGTLGVTTSGDHVRAALAAHSPDGVTNAVGEQVFIIPNLAAYTATGSVAYEAAAGFTDIGMRTPQNIYITASTTGAPTLKVQVGGYLLP